MENINTNTIGMISETKILLWCVEHNITISIPYGEKARYDQIWEANGQLFRVQIKTAHLDPTGESIEFNCYSVSNGKKHFYSKTDIDYFAVWFEDIVYLVPIEECSSTKKLRLTDIYDRAKYANHTNWAKDYRAEEVLKLA